MEKKTTRKNRSGFSKYVVSILLFLLFEAVAITLWLTKNNLFYLLNFSYIGCCLSLGTALFTAGKRYARHFVQLAVGCYMLLYLGVISRENTNARRPALQKRCIRPHSTQILPPGDVFSPGFAVCSEHLQRRRHSK